MKQTRSAITLVEILVVTVIAVMVLSLAIRLWRQYSFELARTATRQLLQQEARQIMKQLAADVRSAEASGISQTDAAESGTTTVSQIRLERVFFQAGENSAGAESARAVRYEVAPPLLRRIGPLSAQSTLDCSQILGTNIEDCRLQLSSTASATAENPASSAQGLEIVLRMASLVPGSRFTVRHVEHTSVFPRAAVSQLQNPGARTLSSLQALDGARQQQAGDNTLMNAFSGEGRLTADMVASLSDGDLAQLKAAQQQSLGQLETMVSNVNQAIEQTRPSTDWSWGAWFGTTNLETIQHLGDQIGKAGTVVQLEEKKRDLDRFFEGFGEEKLQEAFGTRGNASESARDHDLKVEVLRMKMRDRAVLLKNQTAGATATATERTQFEIMQETIAQNAQKQAGESQSDYDERRAREQRLVELYQNCNIGTLVGGSRPDGSDVGLGDESNDYKALDYAQNCRDLLTTKMTALQSKKMTEENIQVIEAEEARRRSARN